MAVFACQGRRDQPQTVACASVAIVEKFSSVVLYTRCPGPTFRSELCTYCRSTHVSVHDSRAPWLRSLAYVVEGWTPLMSSRVQFRQLQSRLQLAIHWTLIDDTLLECTVPTGYVATVPPTPSDLAGGVEPSCLAGLCLYAKPLARSWACAYQRHVAQAITITAAGSHSPSVGPRRPVGRRMGTSAPNVCSAYLAFLASRFNKSSR